MPTILSRYRELIIDVTTSTLLAIAALASLAAYQDFARDSGAEVQTGTGRYLFTAALAYVLLFRRKYPLYTLATLTSLIFIHRVLNIPEYSITSVMLFYAIYAAGRYSKSNLRSLARGLSVGFIIAGTTYSALSADSGPINSLTIAIFVFSFNLFAMSTAWVWGDRANYGAKRQEQLAVQNLELKSSRDEAAIQAVLGERINIARELHDVVAHHVSVIGIQAGAARHTLDTAPHKSAAALEAVERATREVMTELNSLVSLLREDSLVARSPQPALDRLPGLIEQIRNTGLDVRLTTFGTVRDLPTGVALTCYRIIQEALTNVLRHAGPNPTVSATLRYETDRVLLQIEDDGRGAAAYGYRRYFESGGNGVIGMHERVAIYGGTLSAAPKTGGGWRVQAQIPTPLRAPT